MPRKKRSSGPEAVTLALCLDYLRLTNTLHWRANTGALEIGGRYVRFNAPGTPDILIVLSPTGKLCGVEVKSPTGRLRPEQEAFGRNLEAAGGAYLVVRSLADLVRGLESLRGEGA